MKIAPVGSQVSSIGSRDFRNQFQESQTKKESLRTPELTESGNAALSKPVDIRAMWQHGILIWRQEVFRKLFCGGKV